MSRRLAAPLPRRAATAVAITSLILPALLAATRGTALAASTLAVPSAFPTIQAAINAAVDGDTVLVAPGTYNERIDFQSKNIVVQSSGGRDVTIIDGGAGGVVVKLVADPGETPTLRGFTVRNGGGGSAAADSGGIDVSGGPALIENNLVTANTFCANGAIEAQFSAATIRNNVITNNRQLGCTGGIGGGGVSIGGEGTVHLVGNLISGNQDADGGAVTLFAAGSPVIEGNVLRNNLSDGDGGGLWIVNHSDALIRNNLVVGNQARTSGGGIYVGVVSGDRGSIIVNNTIVGNTLTAPDGAGSGIYTAGFPDTTKIANNLVLGGGPGAVVQCEALRDPNPPILLNNDVVTSGTARYGGACVDVTGTAGNISAAPTFADAANGDYHLAAGSAGIDAGRDSEAPPTDIDGEPRPQDGNKDGIAVSDIGSDEVPGVQTVSIDILPGTSPNLVKLQGKGLTVAVALLSTPSFDARTAQVSSLCFGDAGAANERDCTPSKAPVLKDVDRDGDVDLSLVFDTAQTGIDPGDTSACLNGRTAAGLAFLGCDAIVTR